MTTTGLRWGILGPGGIAQAFANDLVLNGLTLQAVGSRRAETAAAFAEKFGVPNVHSSYEDLVADPEVDAIYIATPHPFHAAQALLALEAGKHVLVEKPFTLNAREAEAVTARARELGLVVLEAMWTRFLPHMARIREILAEGTLGELRSIVADHTQHLPSDPSHRLNALELGGGALLDLGIYPISFASAVFGTPAQVTASATFRETGADASVATIFTYGDDRVATTFSASNAHGPNVASILGADGRIDIDAVWYTPTSFTVYNNDDEVLETFTSTVVGRGMQFQALELERLVATGELESALLPHAETVSILATLDDIRAQIGLVYPGE
ncbi:gfo/Idh/MocA family oxidoreductase [Mycetocola manganoxydans]|uniref:Gfo/Idh/MocA family oxidoreductase n=1 Tax=Mycetocola manganoxydans TaxID=699879 RepID=A0A3L6ZZ99_9MICO|nr:Gfo/Idh/MocA family oxidoreductase [Mycetocola manganoxydans]RLP73363.1 gfo/Idh/MocA family oxidoreductase [Mycetocola manganoxydans]GHD42136.1 oxidoreductase [Mycetocola manganoxydans]